MGLLLHSATMNEISRYQATVQKYRPSAKELANADLWHPAIGSEINKQVCIGK
jgi:hypothetical protein